MSIPSIIVFWMVVVDVCDDEEEGRDGEERDVVSGRGSEWQQQRSRAGVI